MTSLVQEHLLLSLLGRAPHRRLDFNGIDQDGFVELCRRHRVAGLVYQSMLKEKERWPAAVLNELSTTSRKTLLDNIVLLKTLKDVADTLKSENMDVILLKGASLLGFLYSEIQLRPMIDLDLLIRPLDWPKVESILRTRGYKMPSPEQEQYYRDHWYHQLVETPGHPSCYVEFHWNIESPERCRIEPQQLFQAARPCEIDGNRYLRLSNDHLLLHLSVHLAHHYQAPSLHWVEDLRRLLTLDDLDWSHIQQLAGDWGVRNCLAYSLGYVERTYPGTLPKPAHHFALSPTRRWILQALATEDPTLPHRALANSPLRHAVSMMLMERWRDVAWYATTHTGSRLARAVGWKAGAP